MLWHSCLWLLLYDTYECVLSHCMNESCHTVWMSHVTLYECVVSYVHSYVNIATCVSLAASVRHIWMFPVTLYRCVLSYCMNESCRSTQMNGSCHMYIQMWKLRHVCLWLHMNVSCHTVWRSHVVRHMWMCRVICAFICECCDMRVSGFMWMCSVTLYEWVMSHDTDECFMSYVHSNVKIATCVSLAASVRHIWKFFVTLYKCVLSHCMNEPCRTHRL